MRLNIKELQRNKVSNFSRFFIIIYFFNHSFFQGVTTMADFDISGRMKVKTLKTNFKKEFGSTLRVYNGVKFADDDATIASIAGKKIAADAEVKARGNTLVGTFTKAIDKNFSIKVRVASKDDTALVPDDKSLTESGKFTK